MNCHCYLTQLFEHDIHSTGSINMSTSSSISSCSVLIGKRKANNDNISPIIHIFPFLSLCFGFDVISHVKLLMKEYNDKIKSEVQKNAKHNDRKGKNFQLYDGGKICELWAKN